jgi:hypothetical protein
MHECHPTVKLSRAAVESERTVKPKPAFKIGPIRSTRSGVGYSAVLGHPDRAPLWRCKGDERIEFLQNFRYGRWRQATNEAGVPCAPIQTFDLIGQNRTRHR